MGDGSCCHGAYSTLRKNRCMQCFVFLVITTLNIADLVSDWMLYHDVKYAEQGLVFGPIDKGIVTALLVFSIGGAILFSLEILNLGLEIFKENPMINVDAASAIVVWFEDVPQIAINVIIVSCREEALSFFQLTKASVVIVGALVRMLIASVRYCRRKGSSKKHTQTCTVIRCLMLIGTVFMVLGSVIVFTFTQAKWTPEGQLVFPTPKNIFKGQYDEDHYFRGAGIYLNLPMKGTRNQDDKWIRLMEINDLKNGRTGEQLIKIDYDKNGELFTFQSGMSNEYNECYKREPNKNTYNLTVNCTDLQNGLNSTLHSSLILKFRYKVPHHHLLLGDITFNGKIKNGQNNQCETISSQNESLNHFELRYFKTKPDINNTHHFVVSQDDTPSKASFYQPQYHLVGISDAWKTGFIGCQSSGRTAPHFNIGLQVDCDNSFS